MSNIGGRVEKLERALNELRTEVKRQQLSSQKIAEDEPQAEEEQAEQPLEQTVEVEVEEKKNLAEATTATLAAPLAARLERSRSGFWNQLKSLFSGKPKIDGALLTELEALLISSDLGPQAVGSFLSELKAEVEVGTDLSEDLLVARLKLKIADALSQSGVGEMQQPSRRTDGPTVVLLVGVNGAGKTTTAAKLAGKWQKGGARVMLVAADTFRAAAVEQLISWGAKLGVPVISGAENAKPQSVVFDAMKRAVAESFDVVIIDTAGRLHTKSNLMQELEGIKNVITKHQPSAPHETILVVDGVTGQNALSQAREFNEATPLTGVIVTKLDGTPKGGIVVAIQSELKIPVRFIGVGESEEDLRAFNAQEFVDALFEKSETGTFSGSSSNAQVRRRRREETPESAQI